MDDANVSQFTEQPQVTIALDETVSNLVVEQSLNGLKLLILGLMAQLAKCFRTIMRSLTTSS